MNKNPQIIQPAGSLKSNFNKILAFVGLGWFTSMLVMRYVIKPLRVDAKMKENEKLMDFLYNEQVKQENMEEKFEI